MGKLNDREVTVVHAHSPVFPRFELWLPAASLPSVWAALGSDVDVEYAKFLPGAIAEAIVEANKQLVPARIGIAIGRDEKNVGCRRWLMRPEAAPTNKFSGKHDDCRRFSRKGE